MGEVSAEHSEAFYEGALGRIRNIMLALAGPLALAAGLVFGWAEALGFLVGSAVAYLNFHWLKSGVAAVADRITGTGKRVSSAGIVARFLLRYLLMAAVAYAIFTGSDASLYGFLAGLFLPVAAMMCEAAYETAVALRRGL